MANNKSFLANKAKLGDITYYTLSMKINDVVEIVKFFSEEPEGEKPDIEELYQRKIDYGRVVNHIAPYLVKTRERFFGAVIIAAHNFSGQQFKSLKNFMADGSIKITSKFPGTCLDDFLSAADNAGLLTLTGREKLIALDGQHRIKALGIASGKVEWKKALSFKPSKGLAEEDLCVILLRHEKSRSRKIFKDLNSTAKITTKSENIIVNDDDVIACVTRKIANEVINAGLVNFYSNALAKRSHFFTTLITIYKATEAFLSQKHNVKFTAAYKRSLPDDATVNIFQRDAKEFWKDITEKIDDWQKAIADPSSRGDDRRIEMRAESLLGLPLIQLALVQAYVRLVENGMARKKALLQLSKIDWSRPRKGASVPEWHSVCFTPAGRITNKELPLTIRIIAYMAGEDLDQNSKKILLDDYQRNHWNPDQQEKKKVKLPPQLKQ